VQPELNGRNIAEVHLLRKKKRSAAIAGGEKAGNQYGMGGWRRG
jgi:hypothetical protein